MRPTDKLIEEVLNELTGRTSSTIKRDSFGSYDYLIQKSIDDWWGYRVADDVLEYLEPKLAAIAEVARAERDKELFEEKECPLCEGCFGGKGYCPECGAFDCCYYAFCKLENDIIKDIVDFATDMQGNPRMTNPKPNDQ